MEMLSWSAGTISKVRVLLLFPYPDTATASILPTVATVDAAPVAVAPLTYDASKASFQFVAVS